MTPLFNPKPISMKLSRDEISELWQFLINCDKTAFTGIHNYKRFAREREYMYRFIVRDLAHRVFLLAMNAGDKEKFTIKVAEIERYTMSVMFRRVESTPFFLIVQEKFIKNLKPLQDV